MDITRINKNAKHKKAKQTGLNKHWEQFRELRRQTTKALATSYKSYVNHQIGDSLKTNPKRFWSFIKANKRENIGIPTLRVNDKPITNDRDKANALNNQFSSVFTNERYPIPVIDHSLYSSMPHLDIGINGIIKQLKNLNQNKATGPDELPARVLTLTFQIVVHIRLFIFRKIAVLYGLIRPYTFIRFGSNPPYTIFIWSMFITLKIFNIFEVILR